MRVFFQELSFKSIHTIVSEENIAKLKMTLRVVSRN